MDGYDEQHVQGDSARAAGDGAAPGSTSRWNPTKEQINMLENFYRQGIRTPSAEQIQQLTSRLRAYGHIEGKNVFYWFQNHKARQRQKQKQESMAYLNHFFHRATQPMFPPPPPLNHHPCPNVMCSPYYIPVQNELGFYQQSPYPYKVLFPGGAKGKPRTEKSVKPRTTHTGVSGYEPMPHGYSTSGGGYMINDVANESTGRCDQETLPLFPLQPTGILQGREYQNPSCGSSTANYADNNSTAALIGSNPEIVGDQPFYDFFSG